MNRTHFFILLLLAVFTARGLTQQVPVRKDSLVEYWAKRFRESKNLAQLKARCLDFEKQNAEDLKSKSLTVLVLSSLLEIYQSYQNSIYPVMEREFKRLNEKEVQTEFQKIYGEAKLERDTVFTKMSRLCDCWPQNKTLPTKCQRVKKYFSEIQFRQDFKTKPAPDFEFTDLKGRQQKLSDYRGHFVLLHFWSMHSIPCVQEISDLKKVYKKYGGKTLEIISVNTDPVAGAWDRETLINFIRQMEMNWTQIADGKEKRIFNLYHVHNYPTLYLLDRQGLAVNPDFILGKELRGEQLIKTLKAVFNK